MFYCKNEPNTKVEISKEKLKNLTVFRRSREQKMSRATGQTAPELPRIIKDTINSDISYEKGKFLGKGGFAKCYEFYRIPDRRLYAGKVVPKSLLQKSHQKVSQQ